MLFFDSRKLNLIYFTEELLFRRWFKRIDGFGGDFKAECNTCGSKIRSQCSRVGNIIKHLMVSESIDLCVMP